jgi:hypothetical protein
LDLALVLEKLAANIDESIDEVCTFREKWEQSNWLCLKWMRLMIAENVKTLVPVMEYAKEFMEKLKELCHLDNTDKSVVGRLMYELLTMEFDCLLHMHDHVTSR